MEFIYKNDEIKPVRKGSKPSSMMDTFTGTVFHNNYLDYLSKCYSSHNGIIVKPDYIWYTILCEMAVIVKNEPEKFRKIFTDSNIKKEVSVFTDHPVVMPIDTLIEEVFKLIPSELKKSDILLDFSTLTKKSIFGLSTAFLDAVSPYYNYSMYMCGYNKINVFGVVGDYQLIVDSMLRLVSIFEGTHITTYFAKCLVTLNAIIDNFDDKEFWKNIFYVTYCGSGHQEEAEGWFKDLFDVYPDVAYVSNFSSHISVIKYKNLDTGKSYEMKSGILSSVESSDYLVPDFEFYINEK